MVNELVKFSTHPHDGSAHTLCARHSFFIRARLHPETIKDS